jgi:hypothetical protein
MLPIVWLQPGQQGCRRWCSPGSSSRLHYQCCCWQRCHCGCGVRGSKDNLDVPVSALPPSLPAVAAPPRLLPMAALLSSRWKGRKAVRHCPCCCTPLCPCPAATAQHLLFLSSLMPPSSPTLPPVNPLWQRWGQGWAFKVDSAVDWWHHYTATIVATSLSKPFSHFRPPTFPPLLLPAPPFPLPS